MEMEAADEDSSSLERHAGQGRDKRDVKENKSGM